MLSGQPADDADDSAGVLHRLQTKDVLVPMAALTQGAARRN
jgi:hypothetical protein